MKGWKAHILQRLYTQVPNERLKTSSALGWIQY